MPEDRIEIYSAKLTQTYVGGKGFIRSSHGDVPAFGNVVLHADG